MRSLFFSTRRLTILISALATSLAMNAAGASGDSDNDAATLLQNVLPQLQKTANGTPSVQSIQSLIPHMQKVVAAVPHAALSSPPCPMTSDQKTLYDKINKEVQQTQADEAAISAAEQQVTAYANQNPGNCDIVDTESAAGLAHKAACTAYEDQVNTLDAVVQSDIAQAAQDGSSTSSDMVQWAQVLQNMNCGTNATQPTPSPAPAPAPVETSNPTQSTTQGTTQSPTQGTTQGTTAGTTAGTTGGATAGATPNPTPNPTSNPTPTPGPNLTATQLEDYYLKQYGGNTQKALEAEVAARIKCCSNGTNFLGLPNYNSLTPQGLAMREADNYLFELNDVSGGLRTGIPVLNAISGAVGVTGWGGVHGIVGAYDGIAGIKDQDPFSWPVMGVGYEGIWSGLKQTWNQGGIGGLFWNPGGF